ncbi:GspE/PulE family protein [Undibacterium sp. SXout7W]|uniref:GspE/PulE family protein n=1 Tax=Undibacterium sp. SXout7W TaxID=3413049 RepID=UPI003BF22325
MYKRITNWIKARLAAQQEALEYPCLLSGDDDSALIRIRSSYLPTVAVIANAPLQATILVADHFKPTAEFKTIVSRVENLGWKLTIKEETTSVIRTHYHLNDGGGYDDSDQDMESSNSTHIDSLLSKAIARHASDIRLHVRKDTTGITLKIHGTVRYLESISFQLGNSLCSHLYTNLADKTGHEKGKQTFAPTAEDQSAKIKRTIDKNEYYLRYQTIPESDGGYDLTLRIQPQGEKGVVPTLEEIGFGPSVISILRRQAKRRVGMILCTGPVGSGKTTTLYCLMQSDIGNRGKYRMTLEDPVEFFQFGVTRVNVEKIGMANSMKRALRVGVDDLLVGEIRDAEMGTLAMIAQDTGQKVFTTLHTNGAHYVIGRLCDDHIQQKRSVVCDTNKVGLIFHQRLIPRLCEKCKIKTTDNNLTKYFVSNLKRLHVPLDGVYIKNKAGCNDCEEGISGRIPVIELIQPDEEYMSLMAKNLDAQAKQYWLNQCNTHITDEDITGKPIINNALYQVSRGLVDVEDVDALIDYIEFYKPTFDPTKQTKKKTQKSDLEAEPA